MLVTIQSSILWHLQTLMWNINLRSNITWCNLSCVEMKSHTWIYEKRDLWMFSHLESTKFWSFNPWILKGLILSQQDQKYFLKSTDEPPESTHKKIILEEEKNSWRILNASKTVRGGELWSPQSVHGSRWLVSFLRCAYGCHPVPVWDSPVQNADKKRRGDRTQADSIEKQLGG